MLKEEFRKKSPNSYHMYPIVHCLSTLLFIYPCRFCQRQCDHTTTHTIITTQSNHTTWRTSIELTHPQHQILENTPSKQISHYILMFDYDVCFETRLQSIEWLWWNGMGFKGQFKQLPCAELACFIMLHELQLLCAECDCESLCWPCIHICTHVYSNLL